MLVLENGVSKVNNFKNREIKITFKPIYILSKNTKRIYLILVHCKNTKLDPKERKDKIESCAGLHDFSRLNSIKSMVLTHMYSLAFLFVSLLHYLSTSPITNREWNGFLG